MSCLGPLSLRTHLDWDMLYCQQRNVSWNGSECPFSETDKCLYLPQAQLTLHMCQAN